MFGFINIYKQKGATSHDVVAALRRITGIKRIGHAGTLDPMAEGVLPVAIGNASRLIEYLTDEKVYVAEVELGIESDTCDTEGSITPKDSRKVEEAEFLTAINRFVGDITQIPPAHSAVHYKGKRLYELARNGVIPDDIPARNVHVDLIEVIEFDGHRAKLEISCSKGTYIRSIVRDIGDSLGTGAVMSGLLRKQSGLFKLDTAVSTEKLQTKADVERHFIDLFSVLPYARYTINEGNLKQFMNGVAIKNVSEYIEGETVLVESKDRLIGVARKNGLSLNAVKVFPIEELKV